MDFHSYLLEYDLKEFNFLFSNNNYKQLINEDYFFQTFGPFTATENEPVNTTIGKVSAKDEDIGKNAEITYSITGRFIVVVSVIILSLTYYQKIIPSLHNGTG